jgi:hypothetical protein
VTPRALGAATFCTHAQHHAAPRRAPTGDAAATAAASEQLSINALPAAGVHPRDPCIWLSMTPWPPSEPQLFISQVLLTFAPGPWQSGPRTGRVTFFMSCLSRRYPSILVFICQFQANIFFFLPLLINAARANTFTRQRAAWRLQKQSQHVHTSPSSPRPVVWCDLSLPRNSITYLLLSVACAFHPWYVVTVARSMWP